MSYDKQAWGNLELIEVSGQRFLMNRISETSSKGCFPMWVCVYLSLKRFRIHFFMLSYSSLVSWNIWCDDQSVLHATCTWYSVRNVWRWQCSATSWNYRSLKRSVRPRDHHCRDFSMREGHGIRCIRVRKSPFENRRCARRRYDSWSSFLILSRLQPHKYSLQCALAKLCYLLSKPELSTKEVRNLISIPLRGELTRPTGGGMQQSTIAENVENIQHLLSQFVKLSSRPSLVPQGGITTESVDSSDAAAPWSWTAAEAATTEAALLPFLIHVAAARDDIDSLAYCLRPTMMQDPSDNLKLGMIPGGIVNCLEPGSGRSPLHVASLNGHVQSVELLLRSGALVHLRDVLGHTALYFVSRFFSTSDHSPNGH